MVVAVLMAFIVLFAKGFVNVVAVLDSMIMRDRNHPSVLIWSLGNESYAGEVLKAMIEQSQTIPYPGHLTLNPDRQDSAFEDMQIGSDDLIEYARTNQRLDLRDGKCGLLMGLFRLLLFAANLLGLENRPFERAGIRSGRATARSYTDMCMEARIT